MDIEQMEQKLSAMLRERRFTHSLGVRDTAAQLAQKWGADAEKAAVSGLLHDCAKHLTVEQSQKIFKSTSENTDQITLSEKGLWHARLGVEIAKTEFGIDDGEILDAIRYHTTGKANMPLLTKIVFIADMIEPGRDSEFAFVPQLRKLTFEDIDRAILQCIDYTIQSILKKGQLLHPATVEARNSILAELRKNNG